MVLMVVVMGCCVDADEWRRLRRAWWEVGLAGAWRWLSW